MVTSYKHIATRPYLHCTGEFDHNDVVSSKLILYYPMSREPIDLIGTDVMKSRFYSHLFKLFSIFERCIEPVAIGDI